ncbi:hypothetical protein FQN54_002562 [Arachnomyces sp. PD_36]|nr:hypothetical protein FQN54_002562 [Arachnomyces sp. PD_36]
MPHSVSSGDQSMENDDVLPDAPATSSPGGVEPKEEPEDEDGVKPLADTDKTPGQVQLADLFIDDDDDEEFPGSSAVEAKAEESPESEPEQPPGPPPVQIDSETMYAFYQRLFPFRPLFQWLNHGIKPSPDFGNREFAFTLQNDAYLRYQSFATGDLLRKEILRLNPSRFEIGPVYSTNPRERKTLRKAGAFKPISKEMVFDIDMTDYDDIRTCCTKANICNKCWSFVTMAIKVVDVALRDDFGFEHILWVYSGRRGAHAWICDKRARNLPDDRRRAIANYLELVRGGSNAGKRVNVKRPLHPHLSRSLDILKPWFGSTVLTDQDTFSTTDQADRLLSLLPDKTLNTALRKKWDSAPSRASASKWADIDALAKTGKSSTLNATALLEAKQDVVLEYSYPRLDAEVSKKLIHLLKSPFVVHPGTGRVCVPIDIRKVEQFDPLSVPTVTQLLSQIDAWDAEHASASPPAASAPDGEGSTADVEMGGTPGGKKLQDYEKTELKPYIDYFRTFVANLNKEERGVKRERGDGEGEGMEF